MQVMVVTIKAVSCNGDSIGFGAGYTSAWMLLVAEKVLKEGRRHFDTTSNWRRQFVFVESVVV